MTDKPLHSPTPSPVGRRGEIQNPYTQFDVKYYKWQLKEVQKEQESNFARLSKVNSTYILETLEVLSFFSYREQSLILTSLVKRNTFYNTLRSIGEFMNDEEKDLLNRFELSKKSQSLREKLELEEEKCKKYKKSVLKKIIKEALEFKVSAKFQSAAVLFFETYLSDNWLITTHLEVEPYYYYYNHIIEYLDKVNNQKIRLGPFIINLPTWFGIYSTGWRFMNDEDIDRMANLIAELCEYFLFEISKEILDGCENVHG